MNIKREMAIETQKSGWRGSKCLVKIVFDDSLPAIDESRFHVCDWEEFYPNATEALPLNMPEPR